MTAVKLTRSERRALLNIGRRAGDMYSAEGAMTHTLMNDERFAGRFAELPATVISDYCMAAARFCFPREARY